MKTKLQLATLGGGCFWCIEAIYGQIKGVKKVVSGYSGGRAPGRPTYREVRSGLTGDAEVVQVTFDPGIITYKDILTVFMTSHDPTTLNQQGADKGTQYRSVIFYHDDDQKKTANDLIKDMVHTFRKPIVTEILPSPIFHKAEDYHQEYYKNNQSQMYCKAVITPKLLKLRKMHPNKIKQR